jgi:hypothetical protein
MHPPAAIIERALHLANITRDNGILFRLFGSCAVYIKCANALEILRDNNREPKDIDAVVSRNDLHLFRQISRNNGWHEQIEVTALTDGSRLRFTSNDQSLTLDVAVDYLRFNQTLNLNNRLSLDWPTISVTDLLLSKLQIAEPSTNDLVDMAALIARFNVATSDESELCLERICGLCGTSWGWYRATVAACSMLSADSLTLAVVLSRQHINVIAERASQIARAVEATPKSLAWKARCFVGDRVQWYTPVESF